MKDNTVSTKEVLNTIQQFSTDPPVHTTTFQNSFQDIFRVLSGANLKGNFKSPNPNSFRRTVSQTYRGSTYTSTGTGSSRVQTWQDGCFGVAVTSAGTPPDSDDAVYNQALSSVLSKMRSDIDLSVSVAQANQVSSMFRSANRTLQYVLSFRKGRWAEAYRDFQRDGPALKKAGSKWLEYQYGWKPFAQDLYNTAIELARNFEPLMIAEGRASSDKITTLSGGTISGVKERCTNRLQRRCYIKVRYRPNSSFTSLISNFTSLNPASFAWELMPYSFVVDWFYDIGGYMRAMETSLIAGCSFKDGFVTEGYLDSCEGSYTGEFVSGNTRSTVALTGAYKRVSFKKRSILVGLPFPRPPVFTCELGSGRLLNAAALLSQHLGVKR